MKFNKQHYIIFIAFAIGFVLGTGFMIKILL